MCFMLYACLYNLLGRSYVDIIDDDDGNDDDESDDDTSSSGSSSFDFTEEV